MLSIVNIIKNGWKCIPSRHRKIKVIGENDELLQELSLEEYQDLREEYKRHVEFEKEYRHFLKTGIIS